MPQTLATHSECRGNLWSGKKDGGPFTLNKSDPPSPCRSEAKCAGTWEINVDQLHAPWPHDSSKHNWHGWDQTPTYCQLQKKQAAELNSVLWSTIRQPFVFTLQNTWGISTTAAPPFCLNLAISSTARSVRHGDLTITTWLITHKAVCMRTTNRG